MIVFTPYGKVTYCQHLETELDIGKKYLTPPQYNKIKNLLTKGANDTDVNLALHFIKSLY